jgi:hypothetical protein
MIEFVEPKRGHIIENTSKARIFYEDCGDMVTITGWENVPSIHTLKKKLSSVDYLQFCFMDGCAEQGPCLIVPLYYRNSSIYVSDSNPSLIVNRGDAIEKHILTVILKGVEMAMKCVKKINYSPPTFKYAIIGDEE